MPNFQEVGKLLIQYGYLDAASDTRPGTQAFQTAVRKYQQFYASELKVDGQVGNKTEFHIRQPRCGLPDISEAHTSLRKWPDSCKDSIGCHQSLNLRSMGNGTERQAWLQALESWNDVCGIRLIEVKSRAESRIWADEGRTESNVLAWSYLPNRNCSQTLEQRYGSQVNWNYRKLLEVMVHELGHAIGISHGPRSSIMHATALGQFTKPQKWDIDEAVKRYGEPESKPPAPGAGYEASFTIGPFEAKLTLSQKQGGSDGGGS